MNNNRNIILSAGTVCYYLPHHTLHKKNRQEKRFLLVHQKSGNFWGFPKGHIEANEIITHTAIRETFEETGINVTLIKGFQEKISYIVHQQEKEVVFFIATTENDTLRIDRKEIITAGWFTYREAYQLLSFPQLQNVLTQAIAFITK